MPEWKDLLAALASFVASFAGAWAAFAFESRRRERETDDRNCAAANRALYTIFNLWNILEQYRKEDLEPYRGCPDAWLNLAARPSVPLGESKFQVSELLFLLHTDKAEVFATLMQEEQRFALVIDLIHARSELILNDVYSRLANAGICIGQPMVKEELERALGVDVIHKLKHFTEAIYKNVGDDLESLRKVYEIFRQVMKTQYPKRKFLQIEFEVKPQ